MLRSLRCDFLQDANWFGFLVNHPPLDNRNVTATVVYNNSQSAMYARDKIHGLEYPPGERLIIRLGHETVGTMGVGGVVGGVGGVGVGVGGVGVGVGGGGAVEPFNGNGMGGGGGLAGSGFVPYRCAANQLFFFPFFPRHRS